MSEVRNVSSVERFALRGNCAACNGTGDSRGLSHPIGVAWNSIDMGCRACKATGSVNNVTPPVEEVKRRHSWEVLREEEHRTIGLVVVQILRCRNCGDVSTRNVLRSHEAYAEAK